MSAATFLPRQAWQPLTPRGVAAFALAPLNRLWLAHGVVAMLCAVTTVWFVNTSWLPVIRQALARLPSGAGIRAGRLHWVGDSPVRLAENRFLALVVDEKDVRAGGRVADFEVVFRGTNVALSSLLGSVQVAYPPQGWILSLDPAEAIPWWGAWESPLQALLGVAVALSLMIVWFVLATLYCPFVRLFGLSIHRQLGWGASWKLAAASLMPGATLMIIGLFCYATLGFDLIRVSLIFLLHFLTGWVYLVVASYFLPTVAESAAASESSFDRSGKTPPAPPPPQNPFASSPKS
jgi:hypothetical protein